MKKISKSTGARRVDGQVDYFEIVRSTKPLAVSNGKDFIEMVKKDIQPKRGK